MSRDRSNGARAVGNAPARVVAVWTPKDSDPAVVEEACPACGERTDRTYEVDGDEYVLSCAECGERVDRLTPGPE